MVSPYPIRDRDRSSRILRATPIIARSMYQELVRARYSRAEVIHFVNKLLEQVQEEPARPRARASSFFDVETGLPDGRAMRSILAFECRRASASARAALIVGCVEIGADGDPALGEHLARILREQARSSDSIGRLDARRYLIIPESGSEHALVAIAERMGEAIARERAREVAWSRARIVLRVAAFERGDSAEELLARCLVSPGRSLVGPAVAEARAGQRRVILALGGGAARSAAHVGVLRALEREGVEIAAIAGSSGGALVGAMYAAGMSAEAILDRFATFATAPLLREMRRAFAAARKANRHGHHHACSSRTLRAPTAERHPKPDAHASSADAHAALDSQARDPRRMLDAHASFADAHAALDSQPRDPRRMLDAHASFADAHAALDSQARDPRRMLRAHASSSDAHAALDSQACDPLGALDAHAKATAVRLTIHADADGNAGDPRGRLATHTHAYAHAHGDTNANACEPCSSIASSDPLALIPDDLYSAMIAYFIGPDVDIASLSLPFSATATDLIAGHPLELTRGSLHLALRASCALPGLFPAQRHQHRLLVDGATLAEIPLTASLGTLPHLCVHLARPTARASRFDTPAAVSERLASLSHEALTRAQLAGCEHLLRVPVEEHGWLGFRNAHQLARLGEEALLRAKLEALPR